MAVPGAVPEIGEDARMASRAGANGTVRGLARLAATRLTDPKRIAAEDRPATGSRPGARSALAGAGLVASHVAHGHVTVRIARGAVALGEKVVTGPRVVGVGQSLLGGEREMARVIGPGGMTP